ncbi:uncharacterized protein TNCV_3378581 [Trichonephila clavipes]|nr:uncharacterized protein TNCV_3378581 [Trichonephila clavipes]
MEEIGGLGIPLCVPFGPRFTLNEWQVSLKIDYSRVSAVDKMCRVYPLDPRPDAVALYSGCTLDVYVKWLTWLDDWEMHRDDNVPWSMVVLQSWKRALEKHVQHSQEKALANGIFSAREIFSRCASVGHSSTDCSLEQKCVKSQPHSSYSKLCPKWKTEKAIQVIKTNRNISYLEARKLIAPQLSQTYAHDVKPAIATISTSSSTTQANLLPSASPIKPTPKIESRLPEPISAFAATLIIA